MSSTPSVPQFTGQTEMLTGHIVKAGTVDDAVRLAHEQAVKIGQTENVFDFYRNDEADVGPIEEDLPVEYYDLLQLMVNRECSFIAAPEERARLVPDVPKDFVYEKAAGAPVYEPFSKPIESAATKEQLDERVIELMRLREMRQRCVDVGDFRGKYRVAISERALPLNSKEGWQLAQNLCLRGEQAFRDYVQYMRDYLSERTNDEVFRAKQYWTRLFPNGLGVFKAPTRYLWFNGEGVDNIQVLDEIMVNAGDSAWIVPIEMQKRAGTSGHPLKRAPS